MKKALVIVGTRPEAIKMARVCDEIKRSEKLELQTLVTGQHKAMLDQVIELFNLDINHNLCLMAENQTPSDVLVRAIPKIEEVIDKLEPDHILVHGDTITTLAGALAAFYQKKNLSHVEAGLRTNNLFSPYPEESNRRLTSHIASLHFAPTTESKNNLLKEGISETNIFVTGNTVIDSLLYIKSEIDEDVDFQNNIKKKYEKRLLDSKIILTTFHRRENFGEGIKDICKSIKQVAKDHKEYTFLVTVHPNPNIRQVVYDYLADTENIYLKPPMDYKEFVYFLSKCFCVLSDSGGLQEEAPTFNKPVLVLRSVTERPEALSAGKILLVGTSVEKITKNLVRLFNDEQFYLSFSKNPNPYGDGYASKKIVNVLENYND